MNRFKALLIVAAFSTIIVSPPLVQKVLAWSAQDHLVDSVPIPSNLTQTQANAYCQREVYYQIDWGGGLFTDIGHGGTIGFFKLARPYVYGHLDLRKCVIVASWGYMKAGRHP